VAIPGHEVEGPEKALVLLLEELVEGAPCSDVLRVERHDLTLCSHDPWMHRKLLTLTLMLPVFPLEGERWGEEA
jgi:hypothetical protein